MAILHKFISLWAGVGLSVGVLVGTELTSGESSVVSYKTTECLSQIDINWNEYSSEISGIQKRKIIFDIMRTFTDVSEENNIPLEVMDFDYIDNRYVLIQYRNRCRDSEKFSTELINYLKIEKKLGSYKHINGLTLNKGHIDISKVIIPGSFWSDGIRGASIWDYIAWRYGPDFDVNNCLIGVKFITQKPIVHLEDSLTHYWYDFFLKFYENDRRWRIFALSGSGNEVRVAMFNHCGEKESIVEDIFTFAMKEKFDDDMSFYDLWKKKGMIDYRIIGGKGGRRWLEGPY